MSTAEELIRFLNLEPLPMEGGYFRETYRSEDHFSAECVPERYGTGRHACTAIYFLLTSEPECFSAMHTVKSDEIFHFYAGDAVEMLMLLPDGSGERLSLGNEVLRGQKPQQVVPRGVIQGCRLVPGGAYALMGTTVAPGFEYDDFSLVRRSELLTKYPSHSELIVALTR